MKIREEIARKWAKLCHNSIEDHELHHADIIANAIQEYAVGAFTIDTAPTDGTLFIGIKGKHVAPTKRGKYYVKWPHEPGGPTFREEWNQIGTDIILPWIPTHWIPMPVLSQPKTQTNEQTKH